MTVRTRRYYAKCGFLDQPAAPEFRARAALAVVLWERSSARNLLTYALVLDPRQCMALGCWRVVDQWAYSPGLHTRRRPRAIPTPPRT